MKQLRSNRLGLLCLSFFLCLGVGISINRTSKEAVKAETSNEKELIIDGDKFDSTATTVETEKEYGGFTFVFSAGIKTQSVNKNSTNKLSENATILIGTTKTQTGYFYNKTPIGTKIKSFKIYSNANASTTVTIGINFSESLIDSYDANALNNYSTTLSNANSIYDVTSKLPTNSKYFWYQVTNQKNSQVQFRITYESGPTLSSLDISNPTTDFKSGDTLSLGSPTITATYSDSTSVTINDLTDSHLSYKLGDDELDINNLPTLSKSNDNGKKVTITYTDDDGQSTSGSYTINVDSGYVTGISIIDPSETLTLPLNGDYTFKAKVEGNEPNESVTWSIKEDDATSNIDEDTGEFVADTTAESITVVATTVGTDKDGNLLTAEREVIISGDRSLTLDKETLSGWTGDENAYTLTATAFNFKEAIYEWISSNEDAVVIMDGEDTNVATIMFNGEGSSNVTVTVMDEEDDMSATCVVTVSQSAVTSITLSEASGQAYIGKTTSFTATVEKVGLATDELTYTSSDADIAEITQDDKSFTVKALKAGETTIKVSSKYTSTTYAEYKFTALEDKVTALSWTNKGSFKIYKGDTLKDFANYSEWKFAPTWLDTERVDNPIVGTGDDDIHLGLYDSSTPKAENEEPLSVDYQFTLSDNGKYLVAFYHGVNSVRNEKVEVVNWREVVEKTESTILTDNFASAIGSKDGYGMPHNQISWAQCFNYDSKIITKISGDSVYTKNYNNQSMLRLGTSYKNGSLTIETSSSMKIKSLIIGLAGWNGATSYSVKVSDGDSQSFNISKASNEVTFNTAISKLVIETINTDRTCISSLTINGANETDISKTDDCLGLESFIDSYMHTTDISFDDNEDTGNCRGDTGYYALAKSAFNVLNDHQRQLFCTNGAYSDEYNRLLAWAKANNEGQIDGYSFGTSTSKSNIIRKIDNTSSITIITITSIIILTGISSLLLFKKKKEN